MKELIKHSLEFQETVSYFNYILDGGNSLSRELLNNVNFQDGSFFSLLPKEADLTRIYKFSEGGILPQFPMKKTASGQYYSEVPTLREELEGFLLSKLCEGNLAIFEDVLRERQSDLFKSVGFSYNKEIFYQIDKSRSNFCMECIIESDAIWFFLCVVAHAKKSFDKEASLADLHQIATNTQYIVLGAYDREGYVFWERIKEKEVR